MELSESIMLALIGLIGTISVPVFRAASKKNSQNASVHVANSKALSMLVKSINNLHDMHKDEDSIFATKKLEVKIDDIAKDISFLKGRSG